MNAPQTVALSAACRLHGEMLEDDAFAGYDGSKEAFDRLYEELFAIAKQQIHPDLLDEDNLEATFYVFQDAVASGELPVDWYLYL